jgi:hypothetical protein
MWRAGTVAGLSAVIAVAGCGGGSGPSKAGFAKKADALCAASNHGRPTTAPRNAKEAAQQAAVEISGRSALDAKLRKLDVPKDLKATFASYNAATTRIIGAFRLMNTAAQGDRQRDYAKYFKAEEAAAQSREGLAVKLGFKTCGRRLPPPK